MSKDKKPKRKVIQKQPHRMSVVAEEKTRLVLTCTEEEKRYVKMLAAKNDMTMSDYLLSFARKQMPKSCVNHCKQSHVPNKETAKILRETDNEKNLEEYKSLDEFWKSLGLDKYA